MKQPDGTFGFNEFRRDPEDAGGWTLTRANPRGPSEGYVAGAYLAFLALLLIYVAIMAGKLGRIQRAIRELADKAEKR